MTDLPCNERNSHPRCNLRPTTREQFGLIYSDLNLAAVPTIARPVPVGAAVSDSKILTASGRVTPVHMVVYTSRSDDSTTVTVSTVKAWIRDFDTFAGPFVESGRLSCGFGSGGGSGIAYNVLNGALGCSFGKCQGTPGNEEGGEQSLDGKHDFGDGAIKVMVLLMGFDLVSVEKTCGVLLQNRLPGRRYIPFQARVRPELQHQPLSCSSKSPMVHR
jgi:hypothetical protein